MEKKIICILVSMLMCATVFSVTGTKQLNVENEEVITNAIETSFCSMYQDWLHYDDGTCENALGLTAGGVLHEVIKLTPDELGSYPNHWFTNIKVMHGWPSGTPQPAHDYVVWMFTGTNHPTDPMTEATIVATGTCDPVNDWVEVDIDDYDFSPTDTVWVGVGWTHNAGEFPCGFDTGTSVPEKSGWLCYGGTTWNQLHLIGYPGAWNLWVQVEPANLPPLTPDAPDGPDNGITDVEYPFEATTTDPEGDPIEYWFEWGDGENSGWVSPGIAQHAWTTAGTFEVTVKARDSWGGESDFSPAHLITIVAGPVLEIQTIRGGLFRVKTIVKNVGATTATNVDYTISLDGGTWINLESTGTIPSIPAGEGKEIKSKLLIGFGEFYVTVTATVPEMSDTRTQHGKMLFIYAKVNPGGG